ncbi:hypothetical protein NUU61_000166 [Penicillium alfredii]|uniref:Rhodopsin domain-containing protein n=1 Tax=Penicillium alfredii TaxID=1506179 RepID=A0A9W9KQN0_9EURO|nr:uncharacterized protein NUU61_000166 [Penicillium alfredii]KAJ5114407.1 hypothetical protein NUU61_000166 [Penicillium alfredii]
MPVTIYEGNTLYLINYVTQILCFALVTPFVFLRLCIRARFKQLLGIDDGSCFIAWISYIATILYSPTVLFVKISLLHILIRVFQPFHRGMISLYCLLAAVITYYFIITFIKIFNCNPVSAYWKGTARAGGTCLSQPGVIIADSVISLVTDVAIFAFPVAFTWSLQMPIHKKVKVVLLLGLGGVAVAFSIYRLVVGIRENGVLKRGAPNETRLFMESILTANAEVGLGLICACLPALNVLTTHRHPLSERS